MARPESIALAGFYPTPTHLLPSLRSLCSTSDNAVLLDPCAGEGEAIYALREALAPRGTTWTVELEATRAGRLQQRAFAQRQYSTTLHADAFCVQASGAADLLYLNPPYDLDKRYGRLEERWLERFLPLVAHGGLLVFVVPVPSLAASADTLSAQLEPDIRLFRFPEVDYQAYRQCVLVGRRRPGRYVDTALRARLLEAAAAPDSVPHLDAALDVEPLEATSSHSYLHLTARDFDVAGVVASFKPWSTTSLVGTDQTVEDLLAARFPTALPPRPAHLALALSAGVLNGKTIRADKPALYPDLLVKSRFAAEWTTVDTRHDKDGNVTGSIQIQRPRLKTTVLRLDTLDFHELTPGASPTGATSIETMNTADLLTHYSAALMELARQAFPALHDPTKPQSVLELPLLHRALLGLQDDLVQAALKLLARGLNPTFAAQTGTGKTTLALTTALALFPEHFGAIRAQLVALGLGAERLRPVRRILVLVPPHLPQNWLDQARAICPDRRAIAVDSAADLDREDAEIFVLSRELAKLGPAYVGIRSPDCPRCGAPHGRSQDELASERSACEAQLREPANLSASLLLRFAEALFPNAPDAAVIRAQLPARFLARTLDRHLPARAELNTTALASILAAAIAALDLPSAEHHLVECLTAVATALPEQVSLAVQLEGRRASLQSWSFTRWSPLVNALSAPAPEQPAVAALLGALHALAEHATFTTRPCGERLFAAAPDPRRWPLAKTILRRYRRKFDLVILDEAHEFNGEGSAQSKAAHRLAELPGVPTILLTGTMTSGHASDLFNNRWATSQDFRAAFGRDERAAFSRAYGYRRRFVPADVDANAPRRAYGSRSDREIGIRDLGEVPGIHPRFILDHLLPTSLFLHLSDLKKHLPPKVELPVPVPLPDASHPAFPLVAEYRRLLNLLTTRIREDRRDPELSGRLWGQFSRLPSFLDLCTEECGPFTVAYPASVGGRVLAEGSLLPSHVQTPKEAWLIAEVRRRLAAGDNVLVYLEHTRTRIVRRLLTLLREHTIYEPVFLDAGKVPARKRQDWIDTGVVEKRRRILLVNADAVKTGLNNLVWFNTAIWFERPSYKTDTVRQGNGRLHRLGQEREVTILYPHYADSIQAAAVTLMAAKISASERVEALSLECALEAAGAGNDEENDALAAMAIGEALHRTWMPLAA